MSQSDQCRTAKLRALLESLPQELHDRIYDLTFTAEPGIHYIDRFWGGEHHRLYISRPLFQWPDSANLLHVDRASRKQFAESYYGGNGAVFVATGLGKHPRSGVIGLCIDWLAMLPLQHRNLIKDVRAAVKGYSLENDRLQDAASPAHHEERGSHWEMIAAVQQIQITFGDKVAQVFTFGYEVENARHGSGVRQTGLGRQSSRARKKR
ncbi:hypothetical protein PRZ48_014604 [Zasmidium cellare]|uniref:Uncharacterized protein n=1 Tax=Zasmidium cellare TaxID=395010 RepID=A0ABR0DZE1_ZASCE|nr:hypothetical protein PRZ48_014604 [Zasmidium cellare]